MKTKTTKIIIIASIAVVIMFCIAIYNAGKRVGNYPCTKPFEELTLLEKIASKVEGYHVKTKDEMKKEEQKAIENARKEKEEQAKNQGTAIAKKINDRIKKGDFTMKQYIQLQTILTDNLENKKITIEEINSINEKLADGKAKIEDYLK